MKRLTVLDDVKSWLWVAKYWIVIYAAMLLAGVAVGDLVSPGLFWVASMSVVVVLVAPVTYRHLVGGGCSLRFQICALVKGALVGMIYFFVALLVDPFVWSALQVYVGWNALSLNTFSTMFYQAWFFAGIIGGFAARIVEVRQMSSVGQITIAGFE